MGSTPAGQAATPGPNGSSLRIGAAGHRALKDPHQVQAAIASGLQDILRMYASGSATAPRVVILSALAEGADRLVVRVAFECLPPGAVELEAILPMTEAEYAETFDDPVAGQELREMLGKAARTCVLTSKPLRSREEREDAYVRVGLHIVRASDVLIAIWDGEPPHGRGGTAEVVENARRARIPRLLISPEGGTIRFEDREQTHAHTHGH